MTVETSSLLGYVLIISGIAIGILAYAIYLNLRDAKSMTSSPDSEQSSEDTNASAIQSQSNSQMNHLPSTPQIEEENDILIETPINKEDVDTTLSQEIDMGGSPFPEKQDLTPVATILREVDTGNLLIRVDTMEYANVEELMVSNHWSRIERLSTDLAEWLTSKETGGTLSKASTSDPKPIEKKPDAPQSMVEEINQILERKLKTEDVDRKAIKIIEMLDGSVKVYIGVDSYPIDEVPFEDVRALIREAVSEWEGSG